MNNEKHETTRKNSMEMALSAKCVVHPMKFFRVISCFLWLKKTLVIILMVATGILCAEEIPLNRLADWQGGVRNLAVKENGIIEGKNQTSLNSVKTLEFEPGKKYYISGEFRQTAGEKPARIFFGYYPIDKSEKEILTTNVSVEKGSESEVVEDAVKGSMELKIRDASSWNKHRRIAFHTEPSLKDLPNFNIVSTPIASIEKTGDFWSVTFTTQLSVELMKGTLVRQHNAGGAMYAAANQPLDTKWKEFYGMAVGILTEPGFSDYSFPIGTRKIRLLLYMNYGSKGCVSEFRNVTFDME